MLPCHTLPQVLLTASHYAVKSIVIVPVHTYSVTCLISANPQVQNDQTCLNTYTLNQLLHSAFPEFCRFLISMISLLTGTINDKNTSSAPGVRLLQMYLPISPTLVLVAHFAAMAEHDMS